MAADSQGDVFIDTGITLVEVPSTDLTCAIPGDCKQIAEDNSGFNNNPWVDGSGNVYIVAAIPNAGGGEVVKYTPSGNTYTPSTLFTWPQTGTNAIGVSALAVDADGNVYLIGTYTNTRYDDELVEYTVSSGYTPTIIVSYTDIGFMVTLALDPSGNIYVGTGDGPIYKLTLSDGTYAPTLLSTAGAGSFVVDSTGNVYYAEGSAGDSLYEIHSGGPVNFGSVNVGNTSAAIPLTFTFDAADVTAYTLGTVLTQGSPNLDFAPVAGGTCLGNNVYEAGQICTVNVKLTPTKAGARDGAVNLLDNAGAVIATAYLQGTGAGPQAVFSPPAISTLGGGFSDPYGVAVDGSGNIYVANAGNSTVEEMPPGCSSSACVTSLGGGFGSPYGVAVDGSGNIYVADHQKYAVYEMPPGCASSACVSSLGGPILFPGSAYPSVLLPLDVAVDGSGNIYVSDDNGWVYEMPPGCASGACMTLLGRNSLGQSIFPPGYGIAVDGSGNVYSTGNGGSAVFEMPPGCTSSACVTTLGSEAFSAFGIGAWGVALDGGGNIYVVEPTPSYPGGNTVFEMPAGCTSSACVTELGAFPELKAITLDGSGNIYVTGQDNTVVTEIQRATPPSLTFAATADGQTSTDSPKDSDDAEHRQPAAGLHRRRLSGRLLRGQRRQPMHRHDQLESGPGMRCVCRVHSPESGAIE